MRILRATASATFENPDFNYQVAGTPPFWQNLADSRDNNESTDADLTFSSSSVIDRAYRLQSEPQSDRWVCFGAEVLHENTSADADEQIAFYIQRTPGSTLYSLTKNLPGPGTTTTLITTNIGSNYIAGPTVAYLTIKVIKASGVLGAGQVVGIKEVRFLYKPRGYTRFLENA